MKTIFDTVYGYTELDLAYSHIFSTSSSVSPIDYYNITLYLLDQPQVFTVYDKDGEQYIKGDPNNQTVKDKENLYGYCVNVTFPITYKSVLRWGVSTSDGYLDGYYNNLMQSSFFSIGDYGWSDIDVLATGKKLYPSFAEELILYSGTHKSNAATFTENEITYYLVEEALSYGWVTEEELAEIGWGKDTDYGFYLIDKDTGDIIDGELTTLLHLGPDINIITDTDYNIYEATFTTILYIDFTHYFVVYNLEEVEQPSFGTFAQIYTLEQEQSVVGYIDQTLVFEQAPEQILGILPVYQDIYLYVIDEGGIDGLDHTHYDYGYKFKALRYEINEGVFEYQCAELWVGWEVKTDTQLEAMGLSLSDPNRIIIGQTTTIQGSTTGLTSDYYWVYEFNSTSSSNWYNAHHYAMNPSPVITGSLETVSSSGTYIEVELTDGGGNVYNPESFRIDTYSDSPEIYFTPEVSSLDSGKCGCIVKFNPNQYSTPFDLPSGLYTISGTTLTWNTSHPLYILFEGKEAYAV